MVGHSVTTTGRRSELATPTRVLVLYNSTQIDININIAFVIQWTACSRTGNPWENAASRVAGES